MKVSEVMSYNPVTVKPETPVSDIYGKFEKFKIHEVIIADEKVVGMVSHKELVIKNIPDLAKTKASNVMISSPTVSSNNSVEEASLIMLNSGVRALPVVDKGKLVGLVSMSDLVDKVCVFNEKMRAIDLMTSVGELVSETDTIGDVRNLMKYYDAHRLPVVDKKGKLTGAISTLGIIKYVNNAHSADSSHSAGMKSGRGGNKFQIDSLPVSNIIDIPIYVDRNTSIQEIVSVMKKKGISIVIVCDAEQKPIGIVTQADIISGFVRSRVGKKVLVEIHGAEDLDPEALEFIYMHIENKAKMLNNLFPLDGIRMRIKKGKGRAKDSGSILYDVEMNAFTGKKALATKGRSWNLYVAVRDALNEAVKKAKKLKEETEKKVKGR